MGMEMAPDKRILKETTIAEMTIALEELPMRETPTIKSPSDRTETLEEMSSRREFLTRRR